MDYLNKKYEVTNKAAPVEPWDHRLFNMGPLETGGEIADGATAEETKIAPEQQCLQTNVVYFCRAERGYKPHHLAVVSNVFTFCFSA